MRVMVIQGGADQRTRPETHGAVAPYGPLEHRDDVLAFTTEPLAADIEVTGRANDGGIDGHCRIPLIDVNVAFQAKRYQTGNNVGIDPVQRLIGSMGQNYDRGIFITSSDFTATAKGWVEEKHSPVVLISGQTFVTQLFELELGITVVPLVKYEINDLFFTSLDN